MPSFRAVTLGGRRNGERKVYIRLTHNRKSRHIPTGLVAMPDDVRGSELTSGALIDKTNAIMREMRENCNKVGTAILSMTVDEVVGIATRRNEYDRNFMHYCAKHLDALKANGRDGTWKAHKTAVRSLEEFNGSGYLTYDMMTTSYLKEYKAYLRTLGRRAPSMYYSVISQIYREAMRELNDTADGEAVIKRDPFSVVTADKTPQTRKRALTLDDVMRIRDCSPKEGRMEMARDMFMLSFYLIGINAVDLYELVWDDSSHVAYNRRKTRSRRKDGAYMRLSVPVEAVPIIEKYKDRYGETVLDFRNRYVSANYFKNAIVVGMNMLGEMLGMEGLTYYAARHTWATVAANECKIDIYVIEKALCHKPAGLGVTETYIKPDYSRIDNANRLVLDRLEEAGL